MRKIVFLCIVLLIQCIGQSSFADGYRYGYEDICGYVLPVDHPCSSVLDSFFSCSGILRSEKDLEKKGFIIICRRSSGLIVARHWALPGYLIKLYLKSCRKSKEEILERLVNRCRGAENIRNLIERERLCYFTVPDKWVYFTPCKEKIPILIVTDMDIVSRKQSIHAWKNFITYASLEELYCIISHGYASSALPTNIPYTRSGLFACIDTEDPIREPRFENVKKHICPKMAAYWDELVRIDGDW